MLGHINGVAACMQKEEPSAIYVHCLAHQNVYLCLSQCSHSFHTVLRVLVSNPFALLAGLYVQELSMLLL